MLTPNDIKTEKPCRGERITIIEAAIPDADYSWRFDGFEVRSFNGAKSQDPAWYVYQVFVKGSKTREEGLYCLHPKLTKKEAIEVMKRCAASRWNEQIAEFSEAEC